MAERMTTSGSLEPHPPGQQSRRHPEPDASKDTPLFNAGKLDQVKKSLEGIQEQSKDIPSSEELAQFLFHITQAEGALEALRIAEVEKASEGGTDG